ncbi:CPW-WPC domain [Babesia duncani]|uniref:CPW-WPC domain n=1 Tax=Babesia duncani TaxID=323732 RepID=A0AAD9PJS1_9APIC|nr:CPW-WPC domain [Babesia duncani]
MILLVYLLVQSVYTISGEIQNETFPLQVPPLVSSQQSFKAFTHQPKGVNVRREEADVITSITDAEKNDPFTKSHCVLDTSHYCPEGWKKIGNECHAPKSYNGPCTKIVQFDDFTIEAKLTWASSCGVGFLYVYRCRLNGHVKALVVQTTRIALIICEIMIQMDLVSFVCLVCCRNIENIVIDASSYTGPCNGQFDFSDYTTEAKQMWATQCPSAFIKCPMDWILNSDGSCTAPGSYKGPCDKNVFFTHFTQPMKIDYALKCNIPFELMWKSLGKGSCIVPHEMDKCQALENVMENGVVTFTNFTTNDKMDLESQCNFITWPCADEEKDGIDWNAPCPLGLFIIFKIFQDGHKLK